MSSPRQTAEAILSQIYAESPAYWPYGLSMDNYDTGKGEGVFLVRAKQANLEPVGFVGWQERRENGERIGYYSVGIVPEHRGQGYAKEAVAKLINIKAARVDKVIALIEKGNVPSQALAGSLGVTIKQAGVLSALRHAATSNPAKQVYSRALRGAGGAGAGLAFNSGMNAMTGSDAYANPAARADQKVTLATLGAILAQPGMGKAVKNYITQQKVNGSGPLMTALTKIPGVSKSWATPTQMVNRFSPMRALSIAALPALANRVPLLIGSSANPASQIIEKDLPDMWTKELDARGVTADQYPLTQLLIDKFGVSAGNALAKKLDPTLKDLGNKAIDQATPIAKDLGGQALTAAKGVASEVARDAVPGIVGGAVGTGLGWQAGKMFFKDNPTLGYEARTKRKNRQDNTKILLSLLGGVGGTLLPNIKGLRELTSRS